MMQLQSSPLSFGLDLEPSVTPRVWRMVLASSLERVDEGVVVLDSDLNVLHCSARAAYLLRRVGMESDRRLPGCVAAVVAEQVASNDPRRTDRLAAISGAGGVVIGSMTLRNAAPASVALFVRSEALRDEELFTVMHDRYGMTRRGFQLAQLVREGLTNRQIAERVQLRESTVKVTLHELYRACGVSSRTSLVALMLRSSR